MAMKSFSLDVCEREGEDTCVQREEGREGGEEGRRGGGEEEERGSSKGVMFLCEIRDLLEAHLMQL